MIKDEKEVTKQTMYRQVDRLWDMQTFLEWWRWGEITRETIAQSVKEIIETHSIFDRFLGRYNILIRRDEEKTEVVLSNRNGTDKVYVFDLREVKSRVKEERPKVARRRR